MSPLLLHTCFGLATSLIGIGALGAADVQPSATTVPAATDADTILHVYDLSEMLAPIQDFPAPDLITGSITEHRGSPSTPLSVFLNTNFEPELAAYLESHGRLVDHTWLVQASAAVQAHITNVLVQVQHRKDREIQISARSWFVPLGNQDQAALLRQVTWHAATTANVRYAIVDQAFQDRLVQLCNRSSHPIDGLTVDIRLYQQQLGACSMLQALDYQGWDSASSTLRTKSVQTGTILETRVWETADATVMHVHLSHQDVRLDHWVTNRIAKGVVSSSPLLLKNIETVDCMLPHGSGILVSTDDYLEADGHTLSSLQSYRFEAIDASPVGVDGQQKK